MCGFAGIVLKNESKPSVSVLRSMADTITHRGPDGEGYHVDNKFGVFFKRLSIVDVKNGSQPLSRDGYTLVFNGEIYNYRAIRSELQNFGYLFTTTSDTEVVFYSIIEWGEKAFNKFNGMWSLAFWDRHNSALLISRDRVGIKPMYYYRSNNIFLFASEIKAILAYGIKSKVNSDDLAEYFHFGYISGEKTIFEGIDELRPGAYMIINNGHFSQHQFWSVNETLPLYQNLDIKILESLLKDSVNLRKECDVEYGALLSGGVDSSLISRMLSYDKSVDVYCAKMQLAIDESQYSKIISKDIGAVLHTSELSRDEIVSTIPFATWLYDEPICFSNAIFMYDICSKARRLGKKVLLSGEGADELFFGYERYFRTLDNIKKLNSKFSEDQILQLGSATFTFSKVKKLLNRDDWSNPWRKEWFEKLKYLPKSDFLTKYDQNTRLSSLLHRQDRMGMGANIEIRVPFLDHNVIEYANNLAFSAKVGEYHSKTPLKRLALKLNLENKIMLRQKIGFSSDIDILLNQNKLYPYLDMIKKGTSSAVDYYNVDYVNKLIETNYNNCNSAIIWKIIAFDIWVRVFIDQTISHC